MGKRKFMGVLMGSSYAQNISIENNKPCGLLGTIQQRIQDCSLKNPHSSTKGNFVLVSKKEGKEVYKDTISGLTWSDAIKLDLTKQSTNHFAAVNACHAYLNEMGGISNKVWILPSKEDYEVATEHGIHKSLPNMLRYFWTSTTSDNNTKAWVYLGPDGSLIKDSRDWEDYSYGYDIRCITR